MGTIHLELSADLQALIDRQIAEGRVPDTQSFVTEAVERFADDLSSHADDLPPEARAAWDEEVAETARRGVADIEAGRFITVASAEEAETWHQDRVARLGRELATDGL